MHSMTIFQIMWICISTVMKYISNLKKIYIKIISFLNFVTIYAKGDNFSIVLYCNVNTDHVTNWILKSKELSLLFYKGIFQKKTLYNVTKVSLFGNNPCYVLWKNELIWNKSVLVVLIQFGCEISCCAKLKVVWRVLKTQVLRSTEKCVNISINMCNLHAADTRYRNT